MKEAEVENLRNFPDSGGQRRLILKFPQLKKPE
jgi:hypothetical protein